MRGVRPVDPRNDCIDLYHSPTIYAPFFCRFRFMQTFWEM
jgi:hypothetical protein